MDPNTTLETIRQAIRYDGPLTSVDRLELLTENFKALDEWLSRGGFPPDAWRRGVTTTALVDEIQRELNYHSAWRRDDLAFYQRQRDDGPPPPPTQEAP